MIKVKGFGYDYQKLLLLGMDYLIKNYKSAPPYMPHSKVS